ncbi:DUF1064 domain-containing protein [Shinella sp. AETb1-6]|uniref:DUF1064 domain-containing protein n=1 Tax=Shinella sp. AETb1-6 TaxID=2692210 RepID=UPI00136DEA75|nr:DUF1064 domain-containing protein [Shinella sp. AETb1-6]MXN51887.1 DUF1064 domain-containing protein [Shinella sp. AETb1-6]
MTLHLTREQGQALLSSKPKRSKYGAEKTLLDGILFDSKAEARFYADLKVRERAGEVTDIELQRGYDLAPNGVHVAFYVADFVFFDRTVCRRRVVDVKGAPATPAFRLKAKLMKACFGIEVEVVK